MNSDFTFKRTAKLKVRSYNVNLMQSHSGLSQKGSWDVAEGLMTSREVLRSYSFIVESYEIHNQIIGILTLHLKEQRNSKFAPS